MECAAFICKCGLFPLSPDMYVSKHIYRQLQPILPGGFKAKNVVFFLIVVKILIM